MIRRSSPAPIRRLTRSPAARVPRVAGGTLDYVLRDLRSVEGGFFSAEDADSLVDRDTTEKREGAFYVWSREEVDKILTEAEARVFRRTYGVEADGNIARAFDPHGELASQNILAEQNDAETVGKLTSNDPETVENLFADSRRKLREWREKRPRPHRDDKIVTAWNGLMISALAHASQVFKKPAYLAAAERAAEFIRSDLYPGRLLRSYREGPGATEGFAEDYACLIQGLLDLYEAGFQIQWLQWASRLQEEMDALFRDQAGGYFSTSPSAQDILFRLQEDHDGAEPSANSVACHNLVRLGRMLNRADLVERAEQIASRFGEILEQSPAALPFLLAGLEILAAEPIQIVLAEREGLGGSGNALLAEVYRHFLPEKILLKADSRPAQLWLGEQVPAIREMHPVGEQPVVYVCHNFTCDLPMVDIRALGEKLKASASPNGHPLP